MSEFIRDRDITESADSRDERGDVIARVRDLIEGTGAVLVGEVGVMSTTPGLVLVEFGDLTDGEVRHDVAPGLHPVVRAAVSDAFVHYALYRTRGSWAWRPGGEESMGPGILIQRIPDPT